MRTPLLRARRPIGLSCVALALVTWAPRGLAQPAPARAASVMQLRVEVRDAHLRGDHDRALALAMQALSIEPSGSLHGIIVRELLDLAGEPPDLERLARALDHAEVCARDAPEEPPSPSRDALLALCREQLTLHAGQFARVVADVGASPTGARVTVAGRPLVAARPGVAYVNPGRVIIEATAPGYLSFRREMEVAAGASARLEIALTRLPEREPADAMPTRRPIGLVVAGVSVGVAALVTSGVAWGLAEGMCGDDTASLDGVCYVASETDARAVQTFDTVTNIGLATAGLAAVGTALYVVLRPSSVGSRPRVVVTAGLGSLGLAGTF